MGGDGHLHDSLSQVGWLGTLLGTLLVHHCTVLGSSAQGTFLQSWDCREQGVLWGFGPVLPTSF